MLVLNITQFYRWGETALMIAVKKGHVRVVQELIHLKADVTIENSSGQTAYSLARSQGEIGIAKLLREQTN